MIKSEKKLVTRHFSFTHIYLFIDFIMPTYFDYFTGIKSLAIVIIGTYILNGSIGKSTIQLELRFFYCFYFYFISLI